MKRSLFHLPCFFLFAVSMAWAGGLSPAEFEQHRKNAVRLGEAKRWEEAAAELSSLAKDDSRKAVEFLAGFAAVNPDRRVWEAAREFMPADDILTEIDTLNRFRRVRIHAFGVGTLGGDDERAFGAFMQRLASRNHGTFTVVD